MARILVSFILFTALAASTARATNVEDEKPLQATGRLTPSVLGPHQGSELRIELRLPPGYRAYSDMFSLELPPDSGFKLGGFRIDPLHEFFDETSKKKRLGVIESATLVAPVEAAEDLDAEKSPLVFRLTYQACTKTYCLFPTTIDVPVEFKAERTAVPAPTARPDEPGFFGRTFQETLRDKSLALVFLFVFVAGFLTSLTPCVFPMIPITLAVLGREAHARNKWQTFLASAIYVLGIALTYSALGLFAASTGTLFGSMMSSPWVLGFVCLVFLTMSLSMFDVFELQPPLWLRDRISHARFDGYGGVFLTGTLAGIVASPCVGPVLVGVLTFVAQSKDLWLGFWLLFTFALGMGQLFLLLGTFSSATRMLPKSGPWMEGIKHFFGLLMLIGFYSYLRMLVPERWYDGAVGGGLILLGSLKGAFEHPLTRPWHKVRKGLCQGLILIGSFFLIVAIFDLREILQPRFISEAQHPSIRLWSKYSDEALDRAKAEGKPVIIDFFADWCAACKELDQFTFSESSFAEKSKSFALLRFDATRDSAELEKLRRKYGIVGLPTIIFHSADGTWRKDLTLTEFEKIGPFLRRMDEALKENPAP